MLESMLNNNTQKWNFIGARWYIRNQWRQLISGLYLRIIRNSRNREFRPVLYPLKKSWSIMISGNLVTLDTSVVLRNFCVFPRNARFRSRLRNAVLTYINGGAVCSIAHRWVEKERKRKGERAKSKSWGHFTRERAHARASNYEVHWKGQNKMCARWKYIFRLCTGAGDT